MDFSFLDNLKTIKNNKNVRNYKSFTDKYKNIDCDEEKSDITCILNEAAFLFLNKDSITRYKLEQELLWVLDDLFCYSGEDSTKFSGIIELIKVLCSFDLSNEVVSYLNKYFDSEKMDKSIDYIGFNYAFLQIGDNFLMALHDVDSAEKWYALAAKRWSIQKEDIIARRDALLCIRLYDKSIKRSKNIFVGPLAVVNKIVDEINNYDKDSIKRCCKYFLGLREQIYLIEENKKSLYESRNLYYIYYKFRSEFYIKALSLAKEEELNIDIITHIVKTSHTDIPLLRVFIHDYHRKTYFERALIDYFKLVVLCEEIKQSLRIKGKYSNTAYYTSINSLKYLLDTKEKSFGKLSFMNVAYMNDPMEGKIFEALYKFGEEELRKTLEYSNVYIKCFTQKIDYLPMWKMYGGDAEGCCIVINWNRTKKLYQKDLEIFGVCYVDLLNNGFEINDTDNPNIDCELIEKDMSQIFDIVNRIKKDVDEEGLELVIAKFITDRIAFLFKDNSYAYEQEQRIFASKDSDINKTLENFPQHIFRVSDFDIVIEEIILGPKCKNIEILTPILKHNSKRLQQNYDFGGYVRVTKSNINYR